MKITTKTIKSILIKTTAFFCTVIVGGFIVYAAGWNTASPTSITNDTSLFTSSGNTLTATKWNEVVNKVNNTKSISNIVALTCINDNASVGAANTWITKTWTASNCGGINKPSDFNYCQSSLKRKDGGGSLRGLIRCNQADGLIFLSTTSARVILECSYTCWN